MSEIIPLRPALPKNDTLWAVMASQGRHTVIADIHATREAAENDCQWRTRQVRTYTLFLMSEQHGIPTYRIQKINKAELPRRWAPLPALGMLRGRFI